MRPEDALKLTTEIVCGGIVRCTWYRYETTPPKRYFRVIVKTARTERTAAQMKGAPGYK